VSPCLLDLLVVDPPDDANPSVVAGVIVDAAEPERHQGVLEGGVYQRRRVIEAEDLSLLGTAATRTWYPRMYASANRSGPRTE
jgi:hypothetical protein